MISVNDHKKLYIPTYIARVNGGVVRFNPEDCKQPDGTYLFDMKGGTSEYHRYLTTKDSLYAQKKKEGLSEEDLLEYELGESLWVTYQRLTKFAGLVGVAFELTRLRKRTITSITFDQENTDYNDEPLIERARIVRKGFIDLRTSSWELEMRFRGAYHITNDIPKSIDIACRSMAHMPYKGNYAVIDLETWFNEEKLVYELS